MKRIFALLLAGLLLVGCGKTEPEPEATEPTESAGSASTSGKSTKPTTTNPTGASTTATTATEPSATTPQPTEAPTVPSSHPTQATEPTVQPTQPSTEPSTPPAVDGWITEDGKTYYQLANGTRHTGWLELNGTRYYLDNQGVLQSGWLTLDGKEYYLKDDGSITRGKAVIQDSAGTLTYYFDANGARVLLVNPWNFVPYEYEPDLIFFNDFAQYSDGNYVDKSCYGPLLEMLQACRAAGYEARIVSSYRRQVTQEQLYKNKVNYYLNLGYDAITAREEAAKVIAIPGTSEHQLGLAVDLIDRNYNGLDEYQEQMPAQKWLMEHCWEYGFILRYPNEKTNVTGIIYEPWHYRYVGVEMALAIRDSGLCLEEYLESLQ